LTTDKEEEEENKHSTIYEKRRRINASIAKGSRRKVQGVGVGKWRVK